jgi:DNA-binding CsgD family transcriptional regulator
MRSAAQNDQDRRLTRRARDLRTLPQKISSASLDDVVSLVRDAAEGDIGGFAWLGGNSVDSCAGPALVTDDDDASIARTFTTRLQSEEHRQVIDFTRLPPEAYRSFLPLGDNLRARLLGTRYYQETFMRLGWIDNLRLIVEDEGCVLAWIGAARTKGSARFSAIDARRMVPVTSSIIDSIVVLSRLLRGQQPELPGDIICDPTGDVIATSQTGRLWIEAAGVRACLREMVRTFDRGDEAPSPPPLVDVTLTRLDAGEGVAVSYLAHLSRRVPRGIARDAALSAAERRVAERAAAGETISGIARAIERSPETVRHQLKSAYRKLAVKSRVELARALGAREADDA